MTTAVEGRSNVYEALRIPIGALGLALSSFVVISYALRTLWGLIFPFGGAHARWLELFFPGFKWLTPQGFLIGIAESDAYGWYGALLFRGLFSSFARLRN